MVVAGILWRFVPDRFDPPTDAAATTEGPADTTGTEPPGTEPTEPVPTEPKPVTETAWADFTVVGDVMTHLSVTNAAFNGTDYKFDGFFKYLKAYASRADFAVANLETTFAGIENGREYSDYPRFNAPDSLADALKNAGFDMLLTANNHSNDTGKHGMRRTLQVLQERGLLNLGTTASAGDSQYRVLNVNGIRVGMICYTYGKINGETGRKSVNGLPVHKDLTDQINIFDYSKLDSFYEEMAANITAMKENGADIIILFIHWGNEYKLKQNGYQSAIAQKMCDLGVDVIAGSHPHVVQPVELLTSTEDPSHRTLCVYSLGNIISNQRREFMRLDTGHTEDGLIFYFTLVKYSNGQVFLDSAEFIPTWVNRHYVGGVRTFDILPLDPAITDWKAAYDLDNAALKRAQASYERTTAIISKGVENIKAGLEEVKADRERIFENPQIMPR